jgi:hypothetical protein
MHNAGSKFCTKYYPINTSWVVSRPPAAHRRHGQMQPHWKPSDLAGSVEQTIQAQVGRKSGVDMPFMAIIQYW